LALTLVLARSRKDTKTVIFIGTEKLFGRWSLKSNSDRKTAAKRARYQPVGR
jgi:3'-phosphoadenosine 5'-phosphosulfate sulfotransferase